LNIGRILQEHDGLNESRMRTCFILAGALPEGATDTIVHWHGLLPGWRQDGLPWPRTPPIAAGMMAEIRSSGVA
jgi:hypothetical protein